MPIQMNPLNCLAGRLVSLITLASVALSAQNSTKFSDPSEEVLKRAFRTEHDSQAEVPLSIVVTYLPSCHPESKLVIRFRSMTQVEVERLQATVASGFAVQELRTAAGTTGFDIDAAVTSMGIKRVRKPVDPKMATVWLTGLQMAASKSFDGRKELAPGHLVHLDDTLYRLEYLGSTQLSITADGCEVDTDCTHDTPLVKWMDAVRRQIEAVFGATEK